MIELRGIRKNFGALRAVDDLTLDIGAGEIFGFIGPNGAGKSTTMRIIAGLISPDAGTAKVDGLDVRTQGDDVRRILGYMPDFLGVYDDLTVDEYLQFFASAFGLERRKRRAVVDSVLELTDLTFKKHAMVSSLSRGMQQRLGVARVLIHDPKVLLLDEPASGLDPRARIEMRSLLTELGRMGKSLMVSSHILTELAEMCSSIGIIERGKLLYAGSIKDAYARARGGERVSIRLEDATQGEHAATLVRGDERVQSASLEGDRMFVELTPGEHSHHFIIERLVTGGVRIASFTSVEVKLEEAFLKLTKGALQ
ncbi:MAG: ABC transporter ATP-binding protein [Phycisphaerales bacterium]|jgi:ABC-2 type transport system ATP-binding protein|nr:ABC transporter ATP-binding protein [Phycisphaerales bacterium]